MKPTGPIIDKRGKVRTFRRTSRDVRKEYMLDAALKFPDGFSKKQLCDACNYYGLDFELLFIELGREGKLVQTRVGRRRVHCHEAKAELLECMQPELQRKRQRNIEVITQTHLSAAEVVIVVPPRAARSIFHYAELMSA